MSASVAALRRRALSTGALMALASGLALYQMTSLVLGPAESRQLHISLSVPTVDLDALSDPVLWNIDFVVGTLIAVSPATAQSHLNVLERSSRSTATASPASTSTPISGTPGRALKPTAGSTATSTALMHRSLAMVTLSQSIVARAREHDRD